MDKVKEIAKEIIDVISPNLSEEAYRFVLDRIEDAEVKKNVSFYQDTEAIERYVISFLNNGSTLLDAEESSESPSHVEFDLAYKRSESESLSFSVYVDFHSSSGVFAKLVELTDDLVFNVDGIFVKDLHLLQKGTE